MHKLILFVKTYKPDFKRAQKLLQSIEMYNEDNIPVYLSVNDEDYDYFRKNMSGNYTIMRDSEIMVSNMKDRWRYQAIMKPQLYRLNLCENYLCIDSDSFFIRPFKISDFMYDENTPYTIMHESKTFLDTMEIIGKDSAKLFHIEAIAPIRKKFGTHGKLWDYGPNPHLWSTKVWQHFHEMYLPPLGYTFESFYNEMELSALPGEAIIYGEYLLKTRLIDILPIDGFFKVYHYKEQFKLEKPYYNIERLKKNYMGIIIQSNWDKKLAMNTKKSFFSKLFSRRK